MNDLNNRNPWQRLLQIAMRAAGKPVANLNGGGPTAALLQDDRFGVLAAGKQKRGDRGRNTGGNLRDRFLGNYAWALGIPETSPNADAPYRIASRASSRVEMQQSFTRGLSTGCIA